MTKTLSTVAKHHGLLTIREIIRRTYKRAITGQTTAIYNKKYIARRIGKTVPETVRIVRWMARNMNLHVMMNTYNFVFVR